MKTLIVGPNAFFRQTLGEMLRARFPAMLVDQAQRPEASNQCRFRRGWDAH